MEADVELSNTVVDLVNRQIREMKRTKASPEKENLLQRANRLFVKDICATALR